ncbi:LPXTG cell wall anchor domain-containing protein [Enterococcus hirae]
MLPQTGEIMNHWYSWLGVFLVILVSTLLYSKTQQKKK